MDKQATRTELLEQSFIIEGYRNMVEDKQRVIEKLKNDLSIVEASNPKPVEKEHTQEPIAIFMDGEEGTPTAPLNHLDNPISIISNQCVAQEDE